VRYADDIVAGFEHAEDARRFLAELHTRLEKFALTLHPEKTRLLEFGRFANAKPSPKGTPGTVASNSNGRRDGIVCARSGKA
jgi:hypothetical protein